MQVNAGPVSQDGSNQGQALGSMMGRPYDNKSIAIDSQLLQSAHNDDHAQALAAAAQQQNDRSAEYAIQQLQGYPGIKDDSHHHHHSAQQHAHVQHNPHAHPLNHAMANQLHPGQLGHMGGQLAHPSQITAQLAHQGHHPGALGHPGHTVGHHDPSAVVSQGVPSGMGGAQYGASSAAISKPTVGGEEYYRIKKYNHKEVERRRRETINKGIDELGKVVPDCDKHKGQILAHAVDYIKMLKDKEETLMKQLTLEKLISEQSINELTSENKTLKSELAQTWKELEHYKRQDNPAE